MTLRVLDRTNETAPPQGEPAPRLDTLAGKTVGFISNGKEGTKGFFAYLERILLDEFAVADVVTRVKSNFSAPADPQIVAEIGRWDASSPGSAIEAVARRAVCITPSLPNVTRFPPSG
jgi:hypothetical protein